LFNVTVEAVPPPEVAPVAEPEDLAEFATAAAATAQQRAGADGPRQAAPTALRAKGIEDESRALTYSGPAEDGSAQVQGNGGGAQKAAAGGTRRERREAARRQGRSGAKPPKSVKSTKRR
jgi:preprotein translocase subunit SecA